MQPPSETATGDPLRALSERTGRSWPHVEECASAAKRRRGEIAEQLTTQKLIPADCAWVTYGSLARDEYTQGSDIDWTLLVDGAADPQHLNTVQAISTTLGQFGKAPGRTGVFGGLVSSHDLIHRIGGDADTNQNTTRRMLLLLELLESREVPGSSGVRERVLRNILRRYLEEDHGYHEIHGYEIRVPRFLLNDIVRFWRTMAVDFAAKRRERAGEGWAIRNVKLRLSRKLIFVAGLAMCLTCELRPPPSLLAASGTSKDFYDALQEVLLAFANRPPLDTLVEFASHFGADAVASELVDQYDLFLGMLADSETRRNLEQMTLEQAVTDPTFNRAREIGTRFQGALTKLFFATDEELTRATQRYGVF